MQSHFYDVIVIGAGGMGSATAYHLAKSSANVLVLEQFQRGHKLGSSHGETRIIRFFYEKQFYTELMKTAYQEWRNLESASGKQLLFITGSINLGKSGNEYIMSVRKSMEAAGIKSEWWDTKQLAQKYPQFDITKDMDILWQKDTGFLYASECVSTHLQLAEKHGAVIHESTPVTHIDWQTDLPIVHTEEKQYQSKKVVVTAGAWTSTMLTELAIPLKATKQQVCYYRPLDSMFKPNQFPVFTEVTDQGDFLYGIPYFGKNGLKVARHGNGIHVSPDTYNREPDADYVQLIDAYVQERIPKLGKSTQAEVCLYTETPDEDFVIDTHPKCPNVLIAAGFSGHGFKFCSLVGRIMAELALTDETTFDISPFRIDRYTNMTSV